MTKSKIILAIVLCLSILLSSCASIVNGSKDEVSIMSNPTAAEIFVNGRQMGPTPGIISLTRGEYHLVEIKKDGYAPISIRTSKSVSGWIFGNIICGGLIGLAIDFITGSAYDVEPDNIHVNLSTDQAVNQIIEKDNINGIELYDENNTLVGKINITWE